MGQFPLRQTRIGVNHLRSLDFVFRLRENDGELGISKNIQRGRVLGLLGRHDSRVNGHGHEGIAWDKGTEMYSQDSIGTGIGMELGMGRNEDGSQALSDYSFSYSWGLGNWGTGTHYIALGA